MEKKLIIESYSTPEQDGYRDKIAIIENNASSFHCQCSTCPNPYRIKDKKPWNEVLGWIACTPVDRPYTWKCVSDEKHKICLCVNNFGDVPARNFDINNSGFFARGVLIHKGWSDTWRGSTACITLPPIIWGTFISKFTLGEKGLLYISNMRKPIVA